MKKYLEYTDEKSHKFWKIEVVENTFTVTFGKFGTNGQSKTKEFDTAEKANTEAEKVTKQKIKKGYQEVSNILEGKHIEELVKVFLYSDFKKLNKLPLLKEDAEIINNLERDNTPEMIKGTREGESLIALIEDDVVFENNLSVDDLFDEICIKFAPKKTIQAIWFAGNVTINGTMHNKEKEDYSDAIIFEKPVKAKIIITAGTSLYFLDKVESQVLYTLNQAEGMISFNNVKNYFEIEIERHHWKRENINYDFSEMSEDLTADNLDKFLINKDEFFVIDEDFECEDEDNKEIHYYYLEEEDELINAIISRKDIFKLKK